MCGVAAVHRTFDYAFVAGLRYSAAPKMAFVSLSPRAQVFVSTSKRVCPRLCPCTRSVWHATTSQVPRMSIASCFPPNAVANVIDPLAIRMMEGTLTSKVSVPTLCASSIATTYFCTGRAQEGSPAVVFLHGFDSNFLEYRRLADEMRDLAFRSYYVDVLGWGFTEKPPVSQTLTYSPADKRAHLLAWKRAVIGNSPIVLAGASIGGGAAIDFALHHPEDVKALVLIGAQAYADKKASAALSVPLFGNALATIGAEVLRSKWLRKLAVSISYHDEILRRSEEVEILGGLHTRTRGWLEANVSFIKGEGYCVSQRVRDLNLPALVVYGEEDRILPSAENATRFLNDLGGYDQVSVLPVPAAGHTPHIEKPADVAMAVAKFIRNLETQKYMNEQS